MNIKPIKSERDYRRVLEQIDKLMGARRNTPESDLLDVLVTLAEAWEEKHWPIDLPDPVCLPWSNVVFPVATSNR
jgi:HTH-type transcriptional regulator/antitoxin HigA